MTNKPKTSTVATFDVTYLQYIDKDSNATQALPKFAQDTNTLLDLYKRMSFLRMMDKKAVNLQRTGKMGTYPSAQGQEAVFTGVGYALQDDDVYAPYYRDHGVLIEHGVSPTDILRYWGGDERGSDFQAPQAREDFPTSVPIGTQCLHATGIAYAIKYRQQKRAVATMIGEGGTSEGDFYEAINAAGVWQLPLVFFVNNNQWAISVPVHYQTACKTFAQKAIAGGFEGMQVDGNDIVAVIDAAQYAFDKARNGGGPTLIETISHRLADHTTADDASRYRDSHYPGALKEAWKEEPILRLGVYLEKQGVWSKDKEAELQQQLSAQLDKHVNEYVNSKPDKATAIFDHLFATLPDACKAQYNQIGKHE